VERLSFTLVDKSAKGVDVFRGMKSRCEENPALE
jgi:hypothetical protein